MVSDTGRANLRRYLGKSVIAQHQLLKAQVGNDGQTVKLNHAQSALDWLRRHQTGTYVINDLDYRAALSLQSDFERVGRLGRLTMSWTPRTESGTQRKMSVGSDSYELSAVAAQQRIHAALKFVGPGLSDILVATCQHHDSLQKY